MLIVRRTKPRIIPNYRPDNEFNRANHTNHPSGGLADPWLDNPPLHFKFGFQARVTLCLVCRFRTSLVVSRRENYNWGGSGETVLCLRTSDPVAEISLRSH